MTEKTVAVLQGMGTLIKVLLQQKLGIGKKKKKLAVQEDTEDDANKLTDPAGSLLLGKFTFTNPNKFYRNPKWHVSQ